MTDVVLACGLAIIRIINDSLGIENRGDLLGRKKQRSVFMGSPKKAPERYITFTWFVFLRGFY